MTEKLTHIQFGVGYIYTKNTNCRNCGKTLNSNVLRLTDRGHYYDGEVLCGFCKGERDRENADA